MDVPVRFLYRLDDDGIMATHGSAIDDEGMNAEPLLQLVKKKRPAKVDGLLYFVNDLRNGVFSTYEQRVMAESECGRRLAQAISHCESLKQRVKEDKQDMTLKYIDCLSYVSCTDEWKHYTTCWAGLKNLPIHQLKMLQEQGALDFVCQKERRNLERCVGNLVSGTVRSADESTDISF